MELKEKNVSKSKVKLAKKKQEFFPPPSSLLLLVRTRKHNVKSNSMNMITM